MPDTTRTASGAADDVTPPRRRSGLGRLVNTIWHEVAKFGLIGAISFIIDLGGMNLLTHTVLEGKPTTARILSGVAATLFALSLIHISEPTRRLRGSRMPSCA